MVHPEPPPGSLHVACTLLPRNDNRYVRSRTPSAFRPVTPPPAPLTLVSPPRPKVPPRPIFALSPLFIIWRTSGMTTKVPVKTSLSPGFAFSTASCLNITSTLRGKLPGGISSEFSWTRTRCQSTNLLFSVSICQFFVFVQAGFLHKGGSVYLNCCSTFSAKVPHCRHVKVP